MNLAAVFIVRVVIRAREWQSQPKGELGLSVSYNVSTQNPKPELTGTQHTDNPLTTQLFPHEWRAHTSPRGVRTISSPQVCLCHSEEHDWLTYQWETLPRLFYSSLSRFKAVVAVKKIMQQIKSLKIKIL